VDYHKLIAANIRGFRKKRGLTQEALAGEVSMHSNYIARVERSEEKLSLDGLLKIARAFKIEPHLLLIPESYKSE
jgi:transcriptional regulator with XRE-family HTH domain